MNVKEWAILDRKALTTVRLSLTPQVAFNISNKKKTTAAMMQTLEKLYEKPFALNKVFFMKRLFNMRMSKNGSVVDHLNDFNGVTNRFESVGINFDDEIRALLFLCSLPDSWNNLVTTVSNSTISGILTLNDVVSSVMNDEMRRKTIGDGISSTTALSVESRVDDNSKVWYVDSEASIHCTPHRNCFTDYVHGDYGHVTIGNRYRFSIVEKGKVKIKLLNRRTLVLKDVRHIPELQKNLISVSGLDRESYFVRFGEKQWKVIKRSMVVARGERIGTLYTLSDDASRKTWIYAISQQSDVYHTSKKWKVLVENEIWNKINRAVMDTAVYLINWSPASALYGGIPEEEWLGKPVNYFFLKVFGCIVYAHIDKEERKKLDFKSHKCVSIGYGGDKYGYRLWEYKHNKIIRSKDVIFDESRLYKHMLQEHGIEKENKEYMKLDEPEDG
ncbi:hypothetical protein RJ640_011968 [Escallonia rubra]|uniref:Retrovirus-related Pol polyprotein from transposon TNT 1-94 n=1 Tax=Escallonia rubra TaxID=112253 RepID=A0AA88RG43_9ASTE|nr:hypothetical protein RJ640_011968 [Escallonia rubra]